MIGPAKEALMAVNEIARDGMLDALRAEHPDASLAAKLNLFGQFVGSWALEVTNYFPDGSSETVPGEWRFGWVLQGRAVQDVYIARSGRHPEYGTAVRIYDPALDAWRIAWSGPVRGRQILLTGRPRGQEIVLEGTENAARLQWIFSHLRGTTFRWRATESQDDGATWKTVQEFRAQRTP
jgi:hypothetical protein